MVAKEKSLKSDFLDLQAMHHKIFLLGISKAQKTAKKTREYHLATLNLAIREKVSG